MYKYKIKNLDCANCALKISDKISKLDEVKSCNISFMMETLTFELNDGADLDETLKKIEKTARKIESGVKIEQ